ncbi:sugar ABC transporter permease [Xaviernesmea oryzae]|uniref:Sugar ABC transporter permease n=1 Tax=Xaviernesmea oryzae TaxID=464029 RepID=A0A1Q9AR63_9HYPH|nr:sugar ABC transporter permease [Xaviernesmea oryzae]OLP57900.1 sugar ABC transporter permease [Xaviernesmea oryzae]SEL31924.1 raffinose/stachyose/melibiose transport system permease protein [Xaviernesmea oryzae]
MTSSLSRSPATAFRGAGFKLPRGAALAVLLLPAFVLFAAFVILPILQAFRFSFFNWNGFGAPSEFVGLKNYATLIEQRHFATALTNTGFIIVVSLFLQLPLALWLALALYKSTRVAAAVRTLFFLPYMLAEVAAGLMWNFVYDGNYGIAHQIGALLGIDAPFVLGDATLVMPAIAVVLVWKYFGFHMMIYIAALQNIPDEMIEAARLDGASKWRIVRHVKLPMIRSAIAVTAFFAVTGSLQLFDLIVPLTNGGPNNASLTIVGFLYQFGVTRMRVGFGSAVSIVLFLICVVVALVYQRALKRMEA